MMHVLRAQHRLIVSAIIGNGGGLNVNADEAGHDQGSSWVGRLASGCGGQRY